MYVAERSTDRYGYGQRKRPPLRTDRYRALAQLLALLLPLAACGSSTRATASPDATNPPAEDAAAAVDPTTDAAVAPTIPVVDELDYLEQLKSKRPDLYASDCYSSLVLKPEYRPTLLGGMGSYASIQTKEYAAADVAADADWVKSMQAAQVLFCEQSPNAGGCSKICTAACAACPSSSLGTTVDSAKSVRPAGYPLCNFVGYLVNLGPSGTPYDKTGQVVSWKIFLEFGPDFRTTLTAASYRAFSDRLAAAGFRGDSKIPLQDGQVRFQYNDIIVHGHSPTDAKIAERVGLEMFGSSLVGHGRGLDVAVATATTGVLDWHHYLCAEGSSKLSADALSFVRFEN